MKIIRQSPGPDGGYPPIQDWAGVSPPAGFDQWPDDLERDTFQRYKGFVITTVVRGVVKSYQPNEAAYEAYMEQHPEETQKPETETGEYVTWSQLADEIRKGINEVKT